MIRNEHEYRVTKSQLRKLEDALGALNSEDLPNVESPEQKWALDLQRQGIEGQADTLRHEIADYETLKSGEVSSLEANSWDELPDILIKARIARGLTQKALAEQLGVKEQQIQQYEASRYQSVSLSRLGDIMEALNVRASETLHLKETA